MIYGRLNVLMKGVIKNQDGTLEEFGQNLHVLRFAELHICTHCEYKEIIQLYTWIPFLN